MKKVKIDNSELFNNMLMNGLMNDPCVEDVEFIDMYIYIKGYKTKDDLIDLYGEDAETAAIRRLKAPRFPEDLSYSRAIKWCPPIKTGFFRKF